MPIMCAFVRVLGGSHARTPARSCKVFSTFIQARGLRIGVPIPSQRNGGRPVARGRSTERRPGEEAGPVDHISPGVADRGTCRRVSG
jgi:hypothetical protein